MRAAECRRSGAEDAGGGANGGEDAGRQAQEEPVEAVEVDGVVEGVDVAEVGEGCGGTVGGDWLADG